VMAYTEAKTDVIAHLLAQRGTDQGEAG